MLKCTLVFVAFVQAVCAYHGAQFYHSQTSDNRDFRANVRSERQLSAGFDWDSPSFDQDSNRRRFNNINTNWNPQWNDPSDSFIFDDDFDSRLNRATTQRSRPKWRTTTQRSATSTVAIPGMGTPRTPCEDRCLSTPEYNPVCGDDNMTYFSHQRIICAQRCGKRVRIKHMGACARST